MTDLQQAMLAQRRVMISGPLEMGLVSTATAQLMFLDGESADPMNVVMNSPGGRIEDALPLLDDAVAPGTAEALQRLSDAQTQLDQSVATAVADRTGQALDWVREQFDRGGVLRGAEAADCGLVDEIR